MIINIPMPDYLVAILLFLVAFAGTLSIMSAILSVCIIWKITRTGTFKTKKWTYTRTKREYDC